MSPRTEKLYRGLLLAYPSRYRQRFADEILGVMMDAEAEGGPRRGRPSPGEAAALVRHGIAMRLRVRGEPGTWRRPLAAVAAVLATLVAVVAGQQVLQARHLAMFFGDRPADHLLQAAVLSVVAWGFFLLRWQVPALLAAAAASAATIWLERGNFEGIRHWGNAGLPANWHTYGYGGIANSHATALALLVPGVLLALLLLRPGIVARSAEVYGRSTLVRVFAIGLLVAYWTDHHGMSQIWATLVAGALLVPGLVREGVLPRAGLLIAFAYGYLVVAQQADGSGSKLPSGGLALASTLAAIPVLVLLIAVIVVSQLEASLSLRQKFGTQLEALGRSIAGTGPDETEPV